jgi:hypothetical protein
VKGPTGPEGPEGSKGSTPIPGRFLTISTGELPIPGTFTISTLNSNDGSGKWNKPFSGTVYITVRLNAITGSPSTNNNYLLITSIDGSTSDWGYSGSIGTIPTESRDYLFGDGNLAESGIANVVMPFMYRGFSLNPDLALKFSMYWPDGVTAVTASVSLEVYVDACPTGSSIVNI